MLVFRGRLGSSDPGDSVDERGSQPQNKIRLKGAKKLNKHARRLRMPHKRRCSPMEGHTTNLKSKSNNSFPPHNIINVFVDQGWLE